MRVLTIIAHPNQTSFCHAVLEQFTGGLEAAGDVSEVVDLYGVQFNPVFGLDDYTQFVHESVPRELLDPVKLKEAVLSQSGGPFRRFMVRRWIRNKDVYDIARLIAQHRPADVVEQQEKVARADGLVFIAPVYWMGFPAMLKGWIERVLAYGFAYSLTPEGWDGYVDGRIPLLKLQKALIINTTFFREHDYDAGGFHEAIARITDDWGLRYPGVPEVEHVYFYAPGAVSQEVRREYLERAYRLGREFSATPIREEPELVATAGSPELERAPE